MAKHTGRSYFIVRHDLESLQVLPGCIWNSEQSPRKIPVGFRQVKPGDHWIGFAYTTSEYREKALSQVTGFYKNISANPRYGKLPPKAARAARTSHAWFLQGESMGRPLIEPVAILPINSFLKRKLFNQRTITRITKSEFNEIRDYTLRNRFSPNKIPCLNREPNNEQEILTIIASTPDRFGIEKIIRAQTRFPDMQVKLRGKSETVHLELEFYSSSFLNHDHPRRMAKRRFVGTRHAKGDGKEVGVLCWINDDQQERVSRHVHKIYELRDLLKVSVRPGAS